VIEVLGGVRSADEDRRARLLLSRFDIAELRGAIVEEAVTIRRRRILKLPDAIVLATARVAQLPLFTRNTKDFNPADAGIIVPYRL
jgi:predicted nucleic acid-binding protein